MKAKKKYNKGGKVKNKRRGSAANKKEQLRRMNELALAAKLMFLEGYADEDFPTQSPIETYLPSNMMNAGDNPEGDAIYDMLQYPWKDKAVIGKRAGYPGNDPLADYSMSLPMDMIRKAQFEKLKLPNKKISLYNER